MEEQRAHQTRGHRSASPALRCDAWPIRRPRTGERSHQRASLPDVPLPHKLLILQTSGQLKSLVQVHAGTTEIKGGSSERFCRSTRRKSGTYGKVHSFPERDATLPHQLAETGIDIRFVCVVGAHSPLLYYASTYMM